MLTAARALKPERIHLVVGHASDKVRAAFADSRDLTWVEQAQQLGTGHAVSQALPGVADESTVLVLYGDVPLVDAEMLSACLARANERRIVRRHR